MIVDDAWLSELMARPVFRVDASGLDEAREDELASHGLEREGAFYYAKVDTSRVDLVARLGRVGFVVVDVNVTFEAPEPRVPQSRGVVVRECTADDVGAVLDIAGSAFKFTRFHLDPLVPAAVAHTIKREWIANYAKKKRGDRLFVALVDGKPAGFNATLTTESGSRRRAVIDLIAVAAHAQRRGVGEALVSAFFDHYRGYDAFVVGTQVANVPSIRLYEKLGFTLAKSHYVLHKHVPHSRS